MAAIKCPGCGHVLGEERDGMLVSERKGRALVSGPLLGARCEVCGFSWVVDPASRHGYSYSTLVGYGVAPRPRKVGP